MQNTVLNLQIELPHSSAGERLDKALSLALPQYSRSYLAELMRQGRVSIDGASVAPRTRVQGGEMVDLSIPEIEKTTGEAQAIDLDIVYEDDEILVINKPPGLVVHPGAGNASGTVMNALLFHEPDLAGLVRAGIVHRLDKDTSGLMVVAKTEVARQHLINALQERRVSRQYLALVQGQVISGGSVEAPIGRHRFNRLRMAVTGNGKPAVSHYRVVERLKLHTLLRVSLESGRTHQIRVHLAHIGFPIFGDPVYGGRMRLPAGLAAECREELQVFRRQALHATRLTFDHPASGDHMVFEADPPRDFNRVLELLRQIPD